MPVIVLVEKDPDDVFLARQALGRADDTVTLSDVPDGDSLLARLKGTAPYEDDPPADLVIVTLDSASESGHRHLRLIKLDPELRRIPVIVLTTTPTESDVVDTYDLGGAGHLLKPGTFAGLVEAYETIVRYWFGTVRLPTS